MLLIVEDNPLASRALTALFNSRGYVTRCVSSAEEALVMLDQSGEPEMMLVDIDLPGMNGIELISRIKPRYPRIIYSLMSADSQELARRLEPLVPFFPKPLNPRTLMAAVDEMMHQSPS